MWASLLLQSLLFCCCCSVSLVSFLLWNNGPGQFATMWKNCLLQNNFKCVCATCAYKVQKLCGACTVQMMQFASCALYAVPRVHVKSEVYFGLYTLTYLMFWRDTWFRFCWRGRGISSAGRHAHHVWSLPHFSYYWCPADSCMKTLSFFYFIFFKLGYIYILLIYQYFNVIIYIFLNN